MNKTLTHLIRTPAFQNITAFAEHAHEGIAFIDLNGTIVFANSYWTKMHGYTTQNELLKKNLCLFHTPREIRTGVLPFIEQVKQKGSLQMMLEHIRCNGSAFQALTKIVALNNDEGQNLGFVIFATDTTETLYLKQSLDSLKLANDHLHKKLVQLCENKRSIVNQIDKIKNTSDKLQTEIIDMDSSGRQNEEAIPIREIRPFDPKKIKELADLAKRLSKPSRS